MKVRIKFSKHGVIKYIGHLDLMRYFQKAFRRTDIDVCYSKGFSPHMIMSFAQPLGVGVESDGEYFDVEIADNYDFTTIPEKLNKEMADGIVVLKAIRLPDNAMNAMASVMAADYILNFSEDIKLPTDLVEKYNEASDIPYIKVTKTGEHPINIKDFVFDVKRLSDNSLFIKVDCSSSGNLKPTVFCKSLFEYLELNPDDYPFHILRTETYCKNDNGQLITLGDL